MQQKLTLQVKLQQKLILTPSLQQAIKLLPMSTLELADMLQQEITENPLLEDELEQQRTESTAESANEANDASDASSEAASEGATEAQAPDAKVDAEPDLDAARRWHVANRIRRSDVGSQKRLLKYFMENTGKILTTEELAYVAREAKEYARRVRELRTEHGYSVATRFTGRPDLKVGQYVLQSKERIAEPHDRKIPEALQKSVYDRDNNTCRVCAWNHERWTAKAPRILELHHLEHHEDRGPNVESNLIVICSKCHDEVHGGKHAAALKKIKMTL